MIKNAMGDMVEFDLPAAKKLKEELDRWIFEGGFILPYELSALGPSTWGYAAALGEIEYLRKELKEFERARSFMPSGLHLPKNYFEDLVDNYEDP
jgi:hypothetical protein